MTPEDIEKKLCAFSYEVGKREAYADAARIADEVAREDSYHPVTEVADRIRSRAKELLPQECRG